MFQLRRILFPTDFSACAEGAFTHAAYLAQRTGAELHVLHVIEGEMDVPEHWADDLRITPEDLAADLDIPRPSREDRPDEGRTPGDFVPILDTEERAEKAAPAILRYVADHEIDLVVMGTHGRRGVRRLLMGSVAEEIVRLAPCPVFTVGGREACDGGWGVRRIVAPTDLSGHAQLAARHAAALAETYGADLDLLHVIDVATLPTAWTPFLGTSAVSNEEVRLRRQELLDGHAAEIAKEFPAIGDVGAIIRIGRPASDIADFAEEHGADLVVVGSHGRTGLERLLMGSVAEQVIRSVACPVFTVKSFGRPLLSITAERPHAEPKVRSEPAEA